jgi:hypothetical protein
MNVSREVVFLIGGGIAYLIIKDVFRFVKFLIDKWSTKPVPPPPNPSDREGQTDAEMLRNISGKLDGVATCVSQLKVEFGINKTKMDFLAKTMKEQNGALKQAALELKKMAIECASRLATCSGRFNKLEEKVGEIKPRRGRPKKS